MIVNVRMMAYQPEEKLRPVCIPDVVHTDPDPDRNGTFAAVWYFGQNENENDRAITSTTCSVSVGDVAELPDRGNFLFLPSGPYKLNDAEYAVYKALPRRDRCLFWEMVRVKLEGE